MCTGEGDNDVMLSFFKMCPTKSVLSLARKHVKEKMRTVGTYVSECGNVVLVPTVLSVSVGPFVFVYAAKQARRLLSISVIFFFFW